MTRRVSIDQMQECLDEVLTVVEQGEPVELTRQDRPVAVLVTIADYERWVKPYQVSREVKFWEAYERFRQEVDIPSLEITPDVFPGPREG